MMVWSPEHGRVFGTVGIVLLCVAWFLLWLLIHLLIPAMQHAVEAALSSPPASVTAAGRSSRSSRHEEHIRRVVMMTKDLKLRLADGQMKVLRSVATKRPQSMVAITDDLLGLSCHRRQLKREFLYVLACLVSGVAVLWHSVSSSETKLGAVLLSYSQVHQVFFSMALGHALNRLWEDWRSSDFLREGLSSDSFALWPYNLCNTRRGFTGGMIIICVIHQLSVLASFSFILATRTLGGVGVLVLFWEVPMLLVLRRHIAYSAQHHVPDWMNREKSVRGHWRITIGVVVLVRGGIISVWVGTTIVQMQSGRHLVLETAGVLGVVLCHALGAWWTVSTARLLALCWAWRGVDLLCAAATENMQARSSESRNFVARSSQTDPRSQKVQTLLSLFGLTARPSPEVKEASGDGPRNWSFIGRPSTDSSAIRPAMNTAKSREAFEHQVSPEGATTGTAPEVPQRLADDALEAKTEVPQEKVLDQIHKLGVAGQNVGAKERCYFTLS